MSACGVIRVEIESNEFWRGLIIEDFVISDSDECAVGVELRQNLLTKN